MLASYQRRVSFDSLTQHREFDVDDPLHIPPQYLSKTTINQSKGLDLSFGFDAPSRKTNMDDIFQSFNSLGYAAAPSPTNYSTNASGYPFKRKKIPKLPPPPSKSILKPGLVNVDISNGLGAPQDGYQGGFINPGVTAPASRKKSIVEMTTEELLAMDAQYQRSGVQLEKLKFDGDGYLPFQTSSSAADYGSSGKKSSYTGSRKIKNIDKAPGPLKKTNKMDELTTLNSYTASYKHKDMDDFFKKLLKIEDVEDDLDTKDKKKKVHYVDDSKIIPESLRNIMVYVSGRRHTWDAIDFVLDEYLEDGDQLIIVSHLPSNLNHLYSGNKDTVNNDDNDDEICEQARISIENLSCYIFKAIELLKKQDLKISIKIEFIKHYFVKDVIKDSIRFYKPQIVIISSLLTNLNLNIDKKYLKLPVYIMERLSIPTLIIPTLLNSSLIISDKLDSKIDSNTFHQLLLNIPIDSNKEYDSNSRIIKPRPRVRTPSTISSSAIDDSEISPFQPTLSPKIKFSDHLAVPRSSNNNNPYSTSQSNSNSNSRRGSTAAYRVKSLLDDDNSSEDLKVGRSKSLSGISTSLSNDEIKRKLSAQSTGSVITPPPIKKKNSIFGGLFKKKK